MPMNTIIQQRRRALGLTQEQVAEILNVSIPAVSKWETGATCPDTALLPALARLLKTDLNTLFCFQEDLTRQEIALVCRQVTDLAQTEGFAAGFQAAVQKIREYPHNEQLLHCLTLQLYGQLGLCPPEEREHYDRQLLAWYRQLSQSEDPAMANSARYLLAGRYLVEDDLDRAQELLDAMPDREGIFLTMADKGLLQVSIWQRQGKHDQAISKLQQDLLLSVQKAELLLNKLVDAELAAGNPDTAREVAQRAEQLPVLLGLWEYSGITAMLSIALAEQDAPGAMKQLSKMLDALAHPMDIAQGPLFSRIPTKNTAGEMLPMVLQALDQDPQYGFLRGTPQWEPLLAPYRGT